MKIDIESLGILSDNEKDKNKINYLRLNAKIRVSGTWTGVYKFSNELESLTTRIKISSAAIEGISGGVSPQGKKTPNIWTGVYDILVLENK